MWVHTTPQMLYALSIMSELSKKQVWTLLMADVVMMLCGLAFDFTTGLTLEKFCSSACMFQMAFVIGQLGSGQLWLH